MNLVRKYRRVIMFVFGVAALVGMIYAFLQRVDAV